MDAPSKSDAAPPGRWAFLSPWCHVLRGRLHLEGRVAHNSSRWEYRWVAVRLPHSQQATMQGVREALDLLARAAAVDNAAWRALLLQCRVPMEEDDQPLDAELAPRFRFVFNEDFLEAGALTPAAACRRLFLADQRASEEYLDARQTLQSMQSEGIAAVPVELQFELLNLQDEVLETHLRDLSTMFDVLQSGRGNCSGNGLLPLEIESIRLDVGAFNAARWSLTHRLTALLSSRLPFSLFAFSLRRSMAEDRSHARSNLGRFLCDVMRVQDESRSTGGVETLSVGCHDGDKWQFAALCSAISAASATKNLRLYGVFGLSDTDEERSWKWQWLAYALFRSTSSVAKALISAAQLSADSVSAIAAVLSSVCPPTTDEYTLPSSSNLHHGNCGFFPEGTEITLLNGGDHSDSFPSVLLEADSWLHIVSDNDDCSSLVVVLPGFGIARAGCSVDDIELQQTEPSGLSGLRALTLALGVHSGDDGADVLAAFLRLVGEPLEFIAIYTVGSYPISMATICQACPRLRELFVDGVQLANAENLCLEADESNSRIERLGLVNAFSTNEQISRLVQSIGKRNTRFSAQLSELNVVGSELSCVVDETNVRDILAMLENNSKLVYLSVGLSQELYDTQQEAFGRYHGEPLAVVESNFDLVGKAAFLSVVTLASASAVNALDEGVLRTIFAFAATCATRVVRVHYM